MGCPPNDTVWYTSFLPVFATSNMLSSTPRAASTATGRRSALQQPAAAHRPRPAPRHVHVLVSSAERQWLLQQGRQLMTSGWFDDVRVVVGGSGGGADSRRPLPTHPHPAGPDWRGPCREWAETVPEGRPTADDWAGAAGWAESGRSRAGAGAAAAAVWSDLEECCRWSSAAGY